MSKRDQIVLCKTVFKCVFDRDVCFGRPFGLTLHIALAAEDQDVEFF